MKQPKQKVIFLTGATGHVGRNLIPVLLESENSSLVLLIRGKSESDVEARLDELLAGLAGSLDPSKARKRVQAVRGDVTQARLGLSEDQYDELARSVTHIIHSAATVKFRTPLAEARQINVDGTRRVMDLARLARRRGRLERVAHISTAFVSGNRGGLIREDELDAHQKFTNSYERTKFEAELLVRTAYADLPWVILRPSIIVGDSKTGATTAFNVLYIPLKCLARGLVRFLPGSPDTPVDIVPVDFVCRAISRILFAGKDCLGRTFHLCAGPNAATTVGHVLELAEDFFRRRRPEFKLPKLRFVSRKWLSVARIAALFLSGPKRRTIRKLRWFVPYLGVARQFDVSSARAVLKDENVAAPVFEAYYPALLEYCLRTDWGEAARTAPGRRLATPAPQEA
jgi:thioester reductase-like protein